MHDLRGPKIDNTLWKLYEKAFAHMPGKLDSYDTVRFALNISIMTKACDTTVIAFFGGNIL